MHTLATIIASALGAGYIKPGPGTWGTLVATLSIGLIWQCALLTSYTVLVGATLTTSIGSMAIYFLPSSWGHDDQRIVIDEVAGLFVTMLFVPISGLSLILGFVLFRIYDIWKPLGVRSFDRMESRISVMLDDLLAGVYACVTLHFILIMIERYG